LPSRDSRLLPPPLQSSCPATGHVTLVTFIADSTPKELMSWSLCSDQFRNEQHFFICNFHVITEDVVRGWCVAEVRHPVVPPSGRRAVQAFVSCNDGRIWVAKTGCKKRTHSKDLNAEKKNLINGCTVRLDMKVRSFHSEKRSLNNLLVKECSRYYSIPKNGI
jgi:hypothetical protein